MKACVLKDIGKLNIEDAEMPVLSDGEVLVRVKASGICGSDIPRAYKTGAYSFPMIIGHEFSGEVVESQAPVEPAASNINNSVIHKKVGVFPLIPCMSCEMCKKKQYEMCSDYGYIGSRQDGALAEYVKVPSWNLIELPENVSYEQAAMLEPLSVAIHAARQAGLLNCNAPNQPRNHVNRNAEHKVQPESHVKHNASHGGHLDNSPTSGQNNKNIAIIGLGTIGLLLTMVLKNAGYNNIFVIGNKDLQKQKALEIGIPEENYFDNSDHNNNKCNNGNNNIVIQPSATISDFLKNSPIDIFFECVGTNDSINTAIDYTAHGGTVVLVGNPAGDVLLDKQIYWKILRRQLQLTGTWNSSFTHSEDDDWHYAIRELEQGRLHPEMLITHEYPLDSIIDGFELMRDKKEEHIKVMAKSDV